MDPMRFFVRASAIFGTVCLFLALFLNRQRARAMEFQEVKPYVFAELPHGRIYKTVHEGCELYLVESDTEAATSTSVVYAQHHYAITTGRGCK